jgi:WD40 repeat protein
MVVIQSSSPGHTRAINALSVVAIGTSPIVCSGGYDGTVRVWRLEPDHRLKLLHEIEDEAAGAIFSLHASELPGGELLLCAGSLSREVRCAVPT